ncbi:hypothetical protein ACA910_010658 [Epithemia clementina (nom. ined.)]
MMVQFWCNEYHGLFYFNDNTQVAMMESSGKDTNNNANMDVPTARDGPWPSLSNNAKDVEDRSHSNKVPTPATTFSANSYRSNNSNTVNNTSPSPEPAKTFSGAVDIFSLTQSSDNNDISGHNEFQSPPSNTKPV